MSFFWPPAPPRPWLEAGFPQDLKEQGDGANTQEDNQTRSVSFGDLNSWKASGEKILCKRKAVQTYKKVKSQREEWMSPGSLGGWVRARDKKNIWKFSSYSEVKWHLFYWTSMRFSHNKHFVPEPGLNLLVSWPKALWTSSFPSFNKKRKKVGGGWGERNITQARLYSIFSFWFYKKLKHFHRFLGPVPSDKVSHDLKFLECSVSPVLM